MSKKLPGATQREELRQYYKDIMRAILANVVRNHQHILDELVPYDISEQPNRPWKQGITFIFRSAAIREQAKRDGMFVQLEKEVREGIAATRAAFPENRAIELDYVASTDMDAIKAAGGVRQHFQ